MSRDTKHDRAATIEASGNLLRRRAVRRLWRAETFYLTGLLLFASLALLARFYAYFSWDVLTARAIQSLASPGMSVFMWGVSSIGSGLTPVILTSITFIAFFLMRRRSEAFALALSAGASALINSWLKKLIARPRPRMDIVTVLSIEDAASFPSGHVTFYVCYFGFLFFVAYALLPRGSVARRGALILTALPILLVGPSRIYLGAHWPSDTLGAYVWSGLWLAFSLHMYRRWKQRVTFHPEQKRKT